MSAQSLSPVAGQLRSMSSYIGVSLKSIQELAPCIQVVSVDHSGRT